MTKHTSVIKAKAGESTNVRISMQKHKYTGYRLWELGIAISTQQISDERNVRYVDFQLLESVDTKALNHRSGYVMDYASNIHTYRPSNKEGFEKFLDGDPNTGWELVVSNDPYNDPTNYVQILFNRPVTPSLYKVTFTKIQDSFGHQDIYRIVLRATNDGFIWYTLSLIPYDMMMPFFYPEQPLGVSMTETFSIDEPVYDSRGYDFNRSFHSY